VGDGKWYTSNLCSVLFIAKNVEKCMWKDWTLLVKVCHVLKPYYKTWVNKGGSDSKLKADWAYCDAESLCVDPSTDLFSSIMGGLKKLSDIQISQVCAKS